MVERLWKFVRIDLWRIRLRDHSKPKSMLISALRVLVLAVRGFDEDKCLLRASALTYFTLLSIVPILALVFGFAKGFGLEAKVETLIMNNLRGQEEMAHRILNFSTKLLEEAKGGVIAGIGVALLIWSVVKMLSNIEKSFNHIWGVKVHRSWVRKFTDYLSFVLICPLLLMMSSSLTLLVKAQLEKLSFLSFLPAIAPLSLKAASLAMIWMLFSFIYQIMPNTRVRVSSALVAGIVAGILFQVSQWAYVTFQIGVTKYGAIYGSFAALPLFLIWMQVSWLVMLFGAELCFAHQNVNTYEFEPDCLDVSRHYKNLLALYITRHILERFGRGDKPCSAAEISEALDIPVRLVREILHELVTGGVLIRVEQEEFYKMHTYHPARDSDSLTVKFILDAMDKQGANDIPGIASPKLDKLRESLDEFDRGMNQSSANVRLKDV